MRCIKGRFFEDGLSTDAAGDQLYSKRFPFGAKVAPDRNGRPLIPYEFDQIPVKRGW